MNMLVIPFLFLGTSELILISAVCLLLFGGKKLPELMHGLGSGIHEFKKGMANEDLGKDKSSSNDTRTQL